MVGGGWVKSYLRTRIARLVPSMRRLTHLSLVSPSQFYKYLSLFSTKLVLAVSSRVARGCSLGGSPFSYGLMHILRKFAPRLVKKGSRLGGSTISLGNNEHSGKALCFLSFSFIFFHFLSISFIFFQFLSFSLSFSQFLSVSFTFVHHRSVYFMFVHFRSVSFIFFHFLSFSFIFLGAQNPFLPRLPHDFL